MKKTMVSAMVLMLSLFSVPSVFADSKEEGSGSKSHKVMEQANPALGFPMREGSNGDANMHNEEGISHYNQGHYDVALKHFTSAGKIDSSEATSHYNIALCLDKLGLHGDATQHFQIAKDKANGRKEILESGILNSHLGG